MRGASRGAAFDGSRVFTEHEWTLTRSTADGVPPDLCNEPVQTFQAFTGDIGRMAD